MASPEARWHYLAYGLRIASNIPLPELKTAALALSPTRSADLELLFERRQRTATRDLDWVGRLERGDGEPWLCCARTSTGYLVRFPDIADCDVRRDGAQIVCASIGLDLDDGDLRHLVLDQAMPLALKLRGFEPLHATAIQTREGVCAFVGPSGAGKSTLAAAFLDAGYPVISDDCLPVYAHDDGIRVVPSYPGVRVTDGTLATIRTANGTATEPGTQTGKRRWTPAAARDTFPTEHQPLRRVYRLTRPDRGSALRCIEPVSPRDGLIEIIRATFRFDDADREALLREFTVWERVVRAVPVRRLWLDDDLRSVRARETVLADVSGR